MTSSQDDNPPVTTPTPTSYSTQGFRRHIQTCGGCVRNNDTIQGKDYVTFEGTCK